MNHFQRIKDLREDRDLTQEEAGKIIGCKQSYYGKYERGEVMMGIDKYIMLAKHYNVSLDYLTGLIDHPEALDRHNTPGYTKTNECTCTVHVPGKDKIKKKLTPKQAELLKQYLEILTK